MKKLIKEKRGTVRQGGGGTRCFLFEEMRGVNYKTVLAGRRRDRTPTVGRALVVRLAAAGVRGGRPRVRSAVEEEPKKTTSRKPRLRYPGLRRRKLAASAAAAAAAVRISQPWTRAIGPWYRILVVYVKRGVTTAARTAHDSRHIVPGYVAPSVYAKHRVHTHVHSTFT